MPAILGGWWAHRKLSETGFGEINGNLLEADFSTA
jgi:hypothetical protein